MWTRPVAAEHAEAGDPRDRDVVRRDRRGARHRRTARSARTSSPRRPSCTRATAASCRRSPRAGTSSSSSPVVQEALGEAGATLDDVDAVAVTQGPGPDRRAARRALGREGARVGARPAARAGRPPARARRLALPRARSGRAAVPLPARERRAHAAARRARPRPAIACSARRSTTRPARRSTRARGCSGSATRAAPRSTGSRASGDPEAFAFPVARVPGLDFSFSGVKTALLYAVRDLGDGELERAARRPRRVLPAGDRARARRARARRPRARAARDDRRRRRRRRELASCAPRCPTPRFAPLALCTDNAAMIASAARYGRRLPYPRYLDLDAYASRA